MKKNKAPLTGLKVLELARVLAGPWAGQLLSDLGAEVIKVESPVGDETRSWGVNLGEKKDSPYFKCTNRGKISTVANFKKGSDLDVVYYLAKKADIIIENFKVGTLKKYGLDYDSLKKLNPGLIYCSITGFGQTGPLANLPGYDFVIQAMGGVMDLTGENTGPPIKPGIAYADLFTSLYSVVAIQAALLARKDSGKGTFIDMSLFDTQLAVLANQASTFLLSGIIPQRMGNAHPSIVPYQVFEVKNGLIVIACGNDSQFRAMCEAFHWDFSLEPEFFTNQARLKNRKKLIKKMSKKLKLMTRKEITTALHKAKVPVGSVNSVKQALTHPQALSREVVKLINGEPFVRTPIILSDFDLNYKKTAPKLGENTKAIQKRVSLKTIWEN